MQQLPQANQPSKPGAFPNLTVKLFTERTVHLAPGKVKQVAVGSYMYSEQNPLFKISSVPDIGKELGTSYETMDIAGKNKYVAFYYIHNFSDKPCEVTITKREE